MSKELKSCPFCGGQAFEYYSGSQFEFCEVVCKECGCRSKRKTEAEAIESWNTRKPIDEIVAQLEGHKDVNQLKFLLSVSDPFQKNLETRLGMYLAFNKAIEIVKGGAE